MTKTALALGLGKSTFTRTILGMDAQLHTKANHGILHNFYPHICTEFIYEHGTSLFYVNSV